MRLPTDLRGPLGENAHHVVSTDEPAESELQPADIVVHEGVRNSVRWITRVPAALPGAAVARGPVSESSWLVGTRDKHTVQFDRVGGFGAALASVELARAAAGNLPCDLPERVELHLGATRHSVEAMLTPAPV